MTDILLANLNKAVGILTKPIDIKTENFSIRFSRVIE
jgi:hypothetical protein